MTTRRMLLGSGLATLAAQSLPEPALAATRRFSPGRLDAARAAAAAAVDGGFAPGSVLVVNTGGRDVLEDVRGLADVERGAPMRRDSLFRIYSMTKPLTSVVAMRLVEQGRLGLEDPVARYIPEFATAKVYAGGETLETLKVVTARRPVTIRDLMRHSAGLTYAGDGSAIARLYAYRGVPTGSGGDKPPMDGSAPVRTLAEFSRLIARQPLAGQPGEAFTYGAGVDVLGRVIEVVRGARLRDVMAEDLFRPLGMASTAFETRALPAERLTAAYFGSSAPRGEGVLSTGAAQAKPLVLADDPQRSVFAERPIDFGGAGAISTADDYLRFLRMLLGRGELDGVRILRPESVAQMSRNQLGGDAMATPGLAKSGLGFGLGFATFEDRAKIGAAAPRGGYFWSGAASTYFWVDPVGRTAGVYLTQVFGDDVRAFYLKVLNALYQS